MKVLYIISALLLWVALFSCKKTSEPYYRPMIASNMQSRLHISITDGSGEDISNQAIGSRLLSFRGETNKPLYIDLHKSSSTWEVSADMPNYHNIKTAPQTGDHFSSRLLISTAKNQLKLKCIFLYRNRYPNTDFIGGSGLILIRIETEQGKVIAERQDDGVLPHLRLILNEGLVSLAE